MTDLSKDDLRRNWLAERGVPPAYRDCTRETWDEGAMPWPVVLDEWSPPGSLAFIGGAGLGKTHLAVATLVRLARDNADGWGRSRFLYLPEFQDRIRSAIGLEADDPELWKVERLKEAALEAPIAIFDDFASDEGGGRWSSGWIEFAIQRRHAYELTTILTSNARSLSAIARTSGRVASRLSEGVVVRLEGTDYRPRKGG